MSHTIGISPKLIAPVFAALTSVATSWIVTGTFSRAELAGLATVVIAAVAGYFAPPGDTAHVDTSVPPDVGDAHTADPEGRL